MDASKGEKKKKDEKFYAERGSERDCLFVFKYIEAFSYPAASVFRWSSAEAFYHTVLMPRYSNEATFTCYITNYLINLHSQGTLKYYKTFFCFFFLSISMFLSLSLSVFRGTTVYIINLYIGGLQLRSCVFNENYSRPFIPYTSSLVFGISINPTPFFITDS